MIRTSITGIGDPFVLFHDGTYYLYATSAPDGFRCFTSADLVNWTCAGYCYSGSKWGENCFWAPEVYEKEGKFYLLYTARWAEKHSLRIGLAVADSPLGPFADLQDGPLFDFGYACIDATMFFDDDGKVYLYYVRDCSENLVDGVHTSQIYGGEVDPKTFAFKGDPVLLTTPDVPWETQHDPEWRWNEGPALRKQNGRYYLNYSVNFYASLEYSVACAESASPLGPFKKYENNPILRYRENDFSGPGHNAFFTAADGTLWTAFHIHTDYEKRGGDRRACFAKVGFDENGKMKILV